MYNLNFFGKIAIYSFLFILSSSFLSSEETAIQIENSYTGDVGSEVCELEQNLEIPLLLVTGCGRSGTKYIAACMCASGLEFGHECLKRDGLSAYPWVFNLKDHCVWMPPKGNQQFKHVFHQVRHPLKCISSWIANVPLDRVAWAYIEACIPEINNQDSLTIKCAKYWYYWNLAAEKISEFTYQVEELEKHLDYFEKTLGITMNRELIRDISKKTNTKLYCSDLSWDYFERELDPELFSAIVNLARKYGYND
jgi:hypothetical protein